MPACSSTGGVAGGSPSTLAGSLCPHCGVFCGCGLYPSTSSRAAGPSSAPGSDIATCHPCWVGEQGGNRPLACAAIGSCSLMALEGHPCPLAAQGKQDTGRFLQALYSKNWYTKEKAAMKHYINSPKTRQNNMTFPHLFNKGCYTSLCSNRFYSQHQDFWKIIALNMNLMSFLKIHNPACVTLSPGNKTVV